VRNKILPATLKSYDGEYAKVLLRHWGGESSDYVEEIMPIAGNTSSQFLPNIGDDVLLAWDDAGDCYMLGAVVSGNQSRPESDERTIQLKSVSSSAATNMTIIASPDGKIQIKNNTAELITIISNLIQALTTATTPTITGPQPLSIAPTILPQLQILVDSMKA